MNNITLSGRTVRVSKEVEYERSDGTKAKLTYVTLAVRGNRKDKEGNRVDDIFTLKFYGDLSDIAQTDLNLESPEKLKAGKKNPIYSRTISISGRLNVYEKEKEYDLEIEFDLSKEKEIEIEKNYILNKTVEFKLNQVKADITVNKITFLDARPSFFEKEKDDSKKSIGNKIKAKIKSYNRKSKKDKNNVEIPM